MPNHLSAIKRIRSNETKRLRNRYQLKSCRTAIKKLKKEKEGKEALTSLKVVSGMLDKLAKRNIIHKRKSASMKSSLAKHVNGLVNQPAAITAAPEQSKGKSKRTASSPRKAQLTAPKA